MTSDKSGKTSSGRSRHHAEHKKQFSFDLETKTVEPNANRVSAVLIGSRTLGKLVYAILLDCGTRSIRYYILILICWANKILHIANNVSSVQHTNNKPASVVTVQNVFLCFFFFFGGGGRGATWPSET